MTPETNMKKIASRAASMVLAATVITLASSSAGAFDLTRKEGSFRASWNVSGTIHLMEFKDRGWVAAGRHEGTIILQTDKGQIPTFETECVAFADESQGGVGRCVWESTDGDLIYVETSSSGMGGLGRSRGKFVGGTGRFDGITGGFSFEWNYNVSGWEDASFDGYTLAMTGNYAVP